MSVDVKSSLGIRDTLIMFHRPVNEIKLISEVMQWQLRDIFHKTCCCHGCATKVQSKRVQFSLERYSGLYWRFFRNAEPKNKDGQSALETERQVGCTSTNTLYVPEILLLHRGQHPWDCPHPYHLSLILQYKVANANYHQEWQLASASSCFMSSNDWGNDI